jgi:hypothetical protein
MQRRARKIIEGVVAAQPAVLLDASVRRPPRSRVFVAIFSGPEPGQQIARSTGLTDYKAALALAKKWEAEARHAREAAKAAGAVAPVTGTLSLGLTQREVARLLDISERAVRGIERRAITKLRRHPLLKRIWREFSESVSWHEETAPLTQQEVEALLGLATTWLERRVLWKVLDLIGQPLARGAHG